MRPRTVQFEPGAYSAEYSTGKSSEYGAPSQSTQWRTVSDKFRLVQSVDATWKLVVPMYSGNHNDIEGMALFSQKVKDALLRESIFGDCIRAGLPLSELLYRLLVLRLLGIS